MLCGSYILRDAGSRRPKLSPGFIRGILGEIKEAGDDDKYIEDEAAQCHADLFANERYHTKVSSLRIRYR
ncbi:hypothetical protein D3C81_1912120 [compost metagenome]